MYFLLIRKDIEASSLYMAIKSCRTKIMDNSNDIMCKLPYISYDARNKNIINEFIKENEKNGRKVTLDKHTIIIKKID